MRRVTIAIALATAFACRPPVATQSHGDPVAGSTVRLPRPGVYVLRRFRGIALPADLKGPDYDRQRGDYFERVLAGRLYLTADSLYHTVLCSDLVDSPGPGPTDESTGLDGRYWIASGRVYFSELVLDGPQDSSAVRINGDTLEFAGRLYVYDRAAVKPRNILVGEICRSLRASLAPSARAWIPPTSPALR